MVKFRAKDRFKSNLKTLIVEMGGVYDFEVTSVDHFEGIN